MNGFIMHVGATNAIDIDDTIKRQRTIDELLTKLPADAPERSFFELDTPLHSAFPSGRFHCWGIPPKALPAFQATEIGDLVLFAPRVGLRGGITHLGVVRALCRVGAWHASRILWPRTPDERLFPWLFFFEAESGFRPWSRFLADMQYGAGWNPRGWYRRIGEEHFLSFSSGVSGYLDFIRQEGHFQPVARTA